MSFLYLINESYTNGYGPYMLNIISLIAILCSIFVITTKNPIISVLFLIGLFANISVYLIILGLTFIGLSYLIVYIGAVSILFIFILMLINIRISELQNNNSNSIPLSIILGISLYYPIYNILPYDITKISFNYLSPYILNTNNDTLYFVTSKIWDGNLGENNHMATIGNVMYTNYNLWLILASFILLLAMVGAIVITIKPK